MNAFTPALGARIYEVSIHEGAQYPGKNGQKRKKRPKWPFPVIALFCLPESCFILCKKMAKQEGPFYITGTIGPVCFYRLDEDYYARGKSSLSGERVKKDPSFTQTMAYAGLLKEASLLASSVYGDLNKDKRQVALYRKLTGTAMRMLKEGKSITATRDQLKRLC